MARNLEAFNCNEDKVGWDGCPFDPHYVYDKDEADDYIRTLKYDAAKAKAVKFRALAGNAEYILAASDRAMDKCTFEVIGQCNRIAEAYEKRAERIKDGK